MLYAFHACLRHLGLHMWVYSSAAETLPRMVTSSWHLIELLEKGDFWKDGMCNGNKYIWLGSCLETHLASSYCKSPPTIPSPTGTGPEILYTIVSRSSLRLILTPLVQREIQGWDWGSHAAKLHAFLKQVGGSSSRDQKPLLSYMPFVPQNGPIKRRADRG